MKILVNPFDEAEKLARERGEWVVGIIETRVFWPQKKQVVHFDGKDLVLLPFQQHDGAPAPTLPAIAIKADSYQLSQEDARKEILRFASALSWCEGQKIEVVMWSGGNIPRSMGILQNSARTDYLDAEHLPVPANDAAKTALAFYREGVSLDNPFYSFLSFYKAFSVAVPNGRDRDAWMTAKRDMLDHKKARERLAEIEGTGTQVDTYLYEQCRHAVAHADREPFVNPDNTDDHFRLTKDLPLMRNFAELAIEKAFGIKRRSTIYREHLYELEGFREVVPKGVIDTLKQGEGLPDATVLDLPDRCLLIAKRRHEQYPLENMMIVGGGWVAGGLVLDFRSAAGAVELRVMLDFMEGKLHFDPMRGFRIVQDRANQQGVKEELAALRFHRCILSNGHLEIWDASTEKRLGCSETYIPLNCFVNTKFFDEEIAALEKILFGR